VQVVSSGSNHPHGWHFAVGHLARPVGGESVLVIERLRKGIRIRT
jgi:hypothetical protein